MSEENDNTQTRQINLLDLLAIPELCGRNFFIPDYQRGYRWGQRQVCQLMDDLAEFFGNNGKGKFYCLQPIVVKKMSTEDVKRYDLQSDTDENTWYEVIDGQQRLTTIRIIFALAHIIVNFSEERFNITYQTRPQLGGIFDQFTMDTHSAPYKIHVPNENNLDIDSWHILQAANYMMDWLAEISKKEGTTNAGIRYFQGEFYSNFMQAKGQADKKSVQVIWYELRDGSDPNETFKRLNDKKVSLNNAELIRSLFLSDSAKYEYDEAMIKKYPEKLRELVLESEQNRKQAHIIEEWDAIEKQFRQPEFWSFITQDGKTEGYSSRIEYLFDLISKKKAEERDELYTFLTFSRMLRNGRDDEGKPITGLWDLWQRVESYFSMLLAWFSDPTNGYEYYHKIGFLITEQGREVLINLLDEARNAYKPDFAKSLNWQIKNDITEGHPDDDIFAYSYDDSTSKRRLWKVLFYYNVESTRSNNKSKFPFNLFKKNNWTLEHIHAQNSERIDRDDKNKWIEWYDENIKALDHLKLRFTGNSEFDPSELISSLQDARNKVNSKNFVFNDFTKSFDSVNAYYDKMAKDDGGTPEIHTISNMALLSGSINTAIGNSAFEVKRQLILSLDAAGEYIPYCTRQVFLKYFNREKPNFSVQQTFYWSEEDRKTYLADLERVLKDVLQAKDPNEEDLKKESNE